MLFDVSNKETTEKKMNQQIIKTFLSRIADHYGKNAYWINNFKDLYNTAFGRVPARLLETWLDDYLINHMPTFCPTLPDVKEYIRSKPMARDEWFLVDRGIFCEHCRTDEEGKDGGLRVISARYYSKEDQKEKTIVVSAQCDCPATQGTGRIWTDTIEEIKKTDPKATIHFDYYDFDLGGKISAVHQSDEMWRHRVKHGYVTTEEENDQLYYVPVWDHHFWTTSMGRVVAKNIGWTIPQEVLLRKSTKKPKNSMLSDSAVDAIFSPYGY